MRRLIALTSIFIVLTANTIWASTGNKGHLYPAIGLAGNIFGNGCSNALQMSFSFGWELAKPVEIVARFGYHPFASTGGLFSSDGWSICTIGGEVKLTLIPQESPLGFFSFGGGGQYAAIGSGSPWYHNFGFGMILRASRSLSFFGEYRRHCIDNGFDTFMFGVKL